MDDNRGSAKEQDPTQDASGKQPIWSYQSNRVSVSIWKHHQKAGSRHTIAISRSYFDRDEGRWKRTNFYDRQDLPDVETCRAKAEAYLNSVNGAAEAA